MKKLNIDETLRRFAAIFGSRRRWVPVIRRVNSKQNDGHAESIAPVFQKGPLQTCLPTIAIPSCPDQSTSFPVKKVEGLQFNRLVNDANYQHIKFKHISGIKTTFKNCNFSFCEFDDASFRQAIFINCDFTSIKCTRSNFREATFTMCTFNYATFYETIISQKELIINAPLEPNIKREFMMGARVNASSIGDVSSIRLFVEEEMRAARCFHSEAWRQSKNGWYRKKYPSAFHRAEHLLKSLGLTFDWYFWGHGEHLPRFIVSMVIIVILLGLTICGFGAGCDLTQPFTTVVAQLLEGIRVAGDIFLDINLETTSKSVPAWLTTSIVAFRYIELGLFTSMVFRYMSHR